MRPGPHAATASELVEQMEAERGGLPFLAYRQQDGTRRLVRLGGDVERVTVGRVSSSDLALPWDEGVSRLHALLERVGGEWTVVDDGLSRNGTYVNGERVTGRRRLKDGDKLCVGETEVLYRAPAEPTGPSDDPTLERSAPTPVTLSEAQRRVLMALCRPFKDSSSFAAPASNQQISEELVLSVDAVKTHLRTLFGKFGVEDLPQHQKRVRLVERAFQSGVVSPRDL